MSKRIYAKHEFITEDENLISICKLLKELFPIDKNIQEKLTKIVCNMIRKEIKENCVIGLGLHKDETSVLVSLYDIKSTENNFYHHGLDEEKNEFYIEVPEDEIA